MHKEKMEGEKGGEGSTIVSFCAAVETLVLILSCFIPCSKASSSMLRDFLRVSTTSFLFASCSLCCLESTEDLLAGSCFCSFVVSNVKVQPSPLYSLYSLYLILPSISPAFLPRLLALSIPLLSKYMGYWS